MSLKRLFAVKSLEMLDAEARGDNRLRRVLGPIGLTSLGVGAIIGAGIFVMTGEMAANAAGPGVLLSFLIAGFVCALAAFCYAEFASMAPVAGSAYTYAYATLGELIAWIIGWDLILEYAMSAAVVAASWSEYFNKFLEICGLPRVPDYLCSDPFTTPGAWFNLPAVLVLLFCTTILVIGIRESAMSNTIMVIVKLAVVVFVILVGVFFVSPANWYAVPVEARVLPEQRLLPDQAAGHAKMERDLLAAAQAWMSEFGEFDVKSVTATADQGKRTIVETTPEEEIERSDEGDSTDESTHLKKQALALYRIREAKATKKPEAIAKAEKKYGGDLPTKRADIDKAEALVKQATEPEAKRDNRAALLTKQAIASFRIRQAEKSGNAELIASMKKLHEKDLPTGIVDKEIAETLIKKASDPDRKREFVNHNWGLLAFFGINGQLESLDDATRSPFMPYGISGVIFGAAIVFFAFIGFDSISTHSEEAINPQRDLPFGIIASLILCSFLYLVVSAVITGMIPYPEIDPKAALATAFTDVSKQTQNPVLKQLLHWSGGLIAIGGLAGMTSVLLITFLSQARIFLAMARDGLLPNAIFGRVHETLRTPHMSTMFTGVIMMVITAFTPIRKLEEMVNIGTLFAFVVVCAAVLLLRIRRPEAKRPFRCPAIYIVGPLGVIANLGLMLFLAIDTWIRLVVWLVIGLVFYFCFGYWHSVMSASPPTSGPTSDDRVRAGAL
ncbi:MAG TPA: amino acid permease [Gemmataceae bacterium]|jgi:amino acid transporter|nr:amino acid permease [Gemmataceae bacterium]